MKNIRRSVFAAPAASTNALNGNGGGIRSSAASATALPFNRCLMRISHLSDAKWLRPASPIFMPVQYVSAAPRSDPAVASSGVSQKDKPRRAARATMTASIPSGRVKKNVASRKPSTNAPGIDTKKCTKP